MTRTSLLAVLFAVPAFAQSGATVCASILMPSDKVACLQAIAGHTVEPGAAAVCNGALMGNDKTACLRGALDKHYSNEELAACRSVLMGNDKASCMAAAGYVPRQQPPPPPAYEDRRSRRDDDRDDDRRSRRRRDDDEDDDATRVLRFTNYHQGTVDRLYYRRVDGRRFHEASLPASVATNQYVDVRVPDEKLEVCVETPDGYRLYWAKVRRSDSLAIGADERNWAQGRCRDLR
jgi:hypothetical protein